MNEHCEETNELYNLMARHIKKRCEERINLYQVEQNENANIQLTDEKDLDTFILHDPDDMNDRVSS